MPLPQDTCLSLLDPNPLQSKTKHAMIVRLTSESLGALDSLPNPPSMEFDFGESPGIYIGDRFFPLRSAPEAGHHELYLRASSASKKTAPLKLYADVVGRFAVERELDDIRDRLRETTQDATNQRTNRHTILIDAPPPDLQVKQKKRKEQTSMFRKPLRPADKIASSSISTSTRSPKPPQSKEADAQTRRHIIHLLAASEKSEEEVLAAVVGSISTSARAREILEEVSEPCLQPKGQSNGNPKAVRLKAQSWREVRPHEWTAWSQPERTAACRAARIALKDLRIPQSDPLWQHMRTPSISSEQRALRGEEEETTKRGISSQDLKERKPKKSQPSTEIAMKNEGVKANGKTSNTQDSGSRTKISMSNSRPTQRGESSLSSGAKISSKYSADQEAPSSTQRDQDARRASSHKSTHATAESSRSGPDPGREKRREGVSDGKGAGKEASLSLKRRAAEESSHPSDPSSSSVLKKRKVEPISSSFSSRPQPKAQKAQTLEVPDTRRREPSPADQPRHRESARVPSPAPRKSPRDGTEEREGSRQPSLTKTRREVPHYTSSEDEDDDKGKSRSSTKASDRQNPSSSNATRLRDRYMTQYPNYCDTYAVLMRQRLKLDRMLHSGFGETGSNSESDDDSEMLTPQELNALADDHMRLQEELTTIAERFGAVARS